MSDVHAPHETDQIGATAEPDETEVNFSHEVIYENLTFEEIAREAYLIYLANGSRDGRDLDDWLEAERRLAAQHPHVAQEPDAVLQQSNGGYRQKSVRPMIDRRRNTRHPAPIYMPV